MSTIRILKKKRIYDNLLISLINRLNNDIFWPIWKSPSFFDIYGPKFDYR